MSAYIHYLPGGGLGDVYREAYFHNALGVLKRWKILHPTDTLTVLLMSHNPASQDWLVGQDWIDEVVFKEFPLHVTWAWESAYRLYPEVFEGKTELRFQIATIPSLYRADLTAGRPKVTQTETIPAIGMANGPYLSSDEEAAAQALSGRLLLHPFGGETMRWMPAELAAALEAQMGPHVLCIGGNYQRVGHAEETGVTLPPRVLAEVVATSCGVVASESSVYYMASMLGRDFVMLYDERCTYAKVQRRESGWAWFFGENNPRCLFLSMPLQTSDRTRLDSWVAAHRP